MFYFFLVSSFLTCSGLRGVLARMCVSFTLEGKKGVVETVATITARLWFVRRVGFLGVIEGHRIEREE